MESWCLKSLNPIGLFLILFITCFFPSKKWVTDDWLLKIELPALMGSRSSGVSPRFCWNGGSIFAISFPSNRIFREKGHKCISWLLDAPSLRPSLVVIRSSKCWPYGNEVKTSSAKALGPLIPTGPWPPWPVGAKGVTANTDETGCRGSISRKPPISLPSQHSTSADRSGVGMGRRRKPRICRPRRVRLARWAIQVCIPNAMSTSGHDGLEPSPISKVNAMTSASHFLWFLWRKHLAFCLWWLVAG